MFAATNSIPTSSVRTFGASFETVQFRFNNLNMVVAYIQSNHKTGSLTIHFSQGSSQTFEWRERTKPNGLSKDFEKLLDIS